MLRTLSVLFVTAIFVFVGTRASAFAADDVQTNILKFAKELTQSGKSETEILASLTKIIEKSIKSQNAITISAALYDKIKDQTVENLHPDLRDNLVKFKKIVEEIESKATPDKEIELSIANLINIIDKDEIDEYWKFTQSQKLFLMALKKLQDKIATIEGKANFVELVKHAASHLTTILDEDKFAVFVKDPMSRAALEPLVKVINAKIKTAAANPNTPATRKIVIKSAWFGDHALENKCNHFKGHYGAKFGGKLYDWRYNANSKIDKFYIETGYSRIKFAYDCGFTCNAKKALREKCSDHSHQKLIDDPVAASTTPKDVVKKLRGHDNSKYCEIDIDESLCFHKDPSPDSPAKSLVVQYDCGTGDGGGTFEFWNTGGSESAQKAILKCTQ